MDSAAAVLCYTFYLSAVKWMAGCCLVTKSKSFVAFYFIFLTSYWCFFVLKLSNFISTYLLLWLFLFFIVCLRYYANIKFLCATDNIISCNCSLSILFFCVYLNWDEKLWLLTSSKQKTAHKKLKLNGKPWEW